MKKFFSLLALAGALVACTPEEIPTYFEVKNAKAEINVEVIELYTAQPISSAITASAGTVSGSVVTLEGSPRLSAQDVTVSTVYDGKTYSQVVKVSDLLAGGEARYSVRLVVGAIPGDVYKYSYEVTKSNLKTQVGYLDYTHGSHSHNGEPWAYNMSEFILDMECSYEVEEGQEVTDVKYISVDPMFKDAVKSLIDSYDGEIITSEKNYEFKVSAWAMYKVYLTKVFGDKTVTIYAEKDNEKTAIAEITVNSVEYSSIQKEEAPIPGHEGHYHYGHGHSHGHGHGAENAGGGIIWAD